MIVKINVSDSRNIIFTEKMQKAPKKYGLGIGLLIVGVVFVAINWYLYHYQNQYMPKLLISGIVIFFLGVGFTIFPGTYSEEIDSKNHLRYLWEDTPLKIKLIWLLFLMAGIVAAVMIMDHYHLKVA